MGTFHQFLTELSAHHFLTSVIFTKFDMCIDTVEIWLGIANGHMSVLAIICPQHISILVSGPFIIYLESQTKDGHPVIIL